MKKPAKNDRSITQKRKKISLIVTFVLFLILFTKLLQFPGPNLREKVLGLDDPGHICGVFRFRFAKNNFLQANSGTNSLLLHARIDAASI
jgi:hypothetical protein